MKASDIAGLLSGCACGCRGDLELTDAGRSFLDDAIGVTFNPPEDV